MSMTKKILRALMLGGCIFLLVTGKGFAQVGIMTTNPDPSCEVDVSASDKGMLIPRINLSADITDSSPVDNPAEGLLIFNIGPDQDMGLYYWSGSKWLQIQTPTSDTLAGPGFSTDEAIVRFDGNSGKLIQNSVVTIDDHANMANVMGILTNAFSLITNPGDGKYLTSDKTGNGTWQMPASMDVKEQGVLKVEDVATLNFTGGNTLRDEGNDEVSVAFYENSVTRDLIQLTSGDSISLNDMISNVAVPWDTEIEKNRATFIHSTSANSSRIYVRENGIYEVNYIINTISKTIQRKTLRVRMRKNGTDIFDYSVCYSFSYNMEDFQSAHNSSSFLVELQANEYIELIANGQTNPGPLLMVPNENVLFVRLLRPL